MPGQFNAGLVCPSVRSKRACRAASFAIVSAVVSMKAEATSATAEALASKAGQTNVRVRQSLTPPGINVQVLYDEQLAK
jgi:hypothetical protein